MVEVAAFAASAAGGAPAAMTATRRRTSSSVIVAHNADFDLSFLNFDARRLLSSPLLNPSLCTLRLARRLLPTLRSRSLDVVAAHLGVSCLNRHRALGDARITAEVFLILLDQLAAHGVTTVGQLLDFQHTARDGRRFEFFAQRLHHAARDRIRSLVILPINRREQRFHISDLNASAIVGK